MSTVSENIKFLRKRSEMTQQEFADKIDIKRSLVGAYEEGRAYPRISNLSKISSIFNVRIDDLVEVELFKMSSKEFEQFRTTENAIKFKILSITVDKEDKENIEFIPQKASAGYLNGYADAEFIKELPRFQLPFLPDNATYRAFEITGDSMLPIKSGTIVIGGFVEKIDDIQNGKTYVLISRTEGIVLKRVFNYISEKGKLYLVSDNRSYSPYDLAAEDVLEIWEARAYISVDFTDPNLDASGLSLSELSNMIMELKHEVTKIKSSTHSSKN